MLRSSACLLTGDWYDINMGGTGMSFGENFKFVRQQKHLTQAAVAEELHVARQTISSWENGRSYPDIGMLVQISTVYDLSLDYLLKEDLSMLKHYEVQTTTSRRQQRLLSVGYGINLGLLVVSYCLHFLQIDSSFSELISVALIVMTFTLLLNYPHFDEWATTKREGWTLFGLIMMLFALNLALEWPDIVAALPSASTVAHTPSAALAGEASGFLFGVVWHQFVWTMAALMAIEIPFQRLKRAWYIKQPDIRVGDVRLFLTWTAIQNDSGCGVEIDKSLIDDILVHIAWSFSYGDAYEFWRPLDGRRVTGAQARVCMPNWLRRSMPKGSNSCGGRFQKNDKLSWGLRRLLSRIHYWWLPRRVPRGDRPIRSPTARLTSIPSQAGRTDRLVHWPLWPDSWLADRRLLFGVRTFSQRL